MGRCTGSAVPTRRSPTARRSKKPTCPTWTSSPPRCVSWPATDTESFMATEVVMPQMGESIAEGTITRWLVKVGDKVERDQPLFEISTDKVDAEIPSPAAGTLLEIRNKEGETVPVNQVVATIGEAGDQPGAAAPAAPAAPPAPPAPPAEAPAPVVP